MGRSAVAIGRWADGPMGRCGDAAMRRCGDGQVGSVDRRLPITVIGRGDASSFGVNGVFARGPCVTGVPMRIGGRLGTDPTAGHLRHLRHLRLHLHRVHDVPPRVSIPLPPPFGSDPASNLNGAFVMAVAVQLQCRGLQRPSVSLRDRRRSGLPSLARPHSDAIRHAFQSAHRAGCTQFSQRGSRERSESSRSLRSASRPASRPGVTLSLEFPPDVF